MKKAFRIIGISLLLIVVVYIILCAVAPPFSVERSTVINAKDSVIFSKYSHFKEWDNWSPFTEKDPNIANTSKYSGIPGTKGHQVEWESRSQGSGRMEIVEAIPYNYVKTALYFKPNDDKPGYSEFKLTPEGTGTRVTWSMKGEMGFIMKGMFMIIGVNKMLGKTFERGLERLKTECEK